MILYIVRHGIAVDRSDPNSPPDPERPLTARGIKKTRLAALGLAKFDIKPDPFITSPLIRAVQTAEIFAEALHGKNFNAKLQRRKGNYSFALN